MTQRGLGAVPARGQASEVDVQLTVGKAVPAAVGEMDRQCALAHADGAGDHDVAGGRGPQTGAERVEILVPAGEIEEIGGKVARAVDGRLGERRAGRTGRPDIEGGVGVENGMEHLVENRLWARPGSGQQVAAALIDLERIGLPATAVQRRHQLSPQAVPQRVLVHQPAQFREESAVPPLCEVRDHAFLQRLQPCLLQTRLLRHREEFGGPAEGGAAPQRQRGGQLCRGLGMARTAYRLVSRLDVPTELRQVGRRLRRRQRVTRPGPLDVDVRDEQFAQAGGVRVDLRPPGPWWLSCPTAHC
ncbi:hypothetical protein GCM10020000_79740 [Streptomyces olivoverticillatus]